MTRRKQGAAFRLGAFARSAVDAVAGISERRMEGVRAADAKLATDMIFAINRLNTNVVKLTYRVDAMLKALDKDGPIISPIKTMTKVMSSRGSLVGSIQNLCRSIDRMEEKLDTEQNTE